MWWGWCIFDRSSVHNQRLRCDITAFSSFEFDGQVDHGQQDISNSFAPQLWILKMPTNRRNLGRTNSKWFMCSRSVPIGNNPNYITAHLFPPQSTMHQKWAYLFLAWTAWGYKSKNGKGSTPPIVVEKTDQGYSTTKVWQSATSYIKSMTNASALYGS